MSQTHLIPDTRNVLNVWKHADNDSLVSGMAWYDAAHDFAGRLDPDNVSRAAGVIAALSPLSGWANNKRCAVEIYNGVTSGLGLSGSTAKAVRIFNGEAPLDVLGGDKVRAFYATILDPHNPDSMPVIDRHAHDIAVGIRLPNNHKSRSMGKRRYQDFVWVYNECARTIGIGAPQLQAITWLTWRKKYGVESYG